MSEIALFIPCFNEAKRLNLNSFSEFILENSGLIDFYFIDDGSRDNTAEIIISHLLVFENCFLISTGQNLGKGNALKSGFSKVDTEKYNYFAFIDSDMDIPLDQIPKLHKKIEKENAQIAICNREFVKNFKILRIRSYTSLVMVWVANYLIGYTEIINDTQCGCKMFRTNLVEYCFSENFISEWLFDIEMFIRLRQQFPDSRKTIVEVPLKTELGIRKSRSKLLSSHKILHQLYRIKRNYT